MTGSRLSGYGRSYRHGEGDAVHFISILPPLGPAQETDVDGGEIAMDLTLDLEVGLVECRELGRLQLLVFGLSLFRLEDVSLADGRSDGRTGVCWSGAGFVWGSGLVYWL